MGDPRQLDATGARDRDGAPSVVEKTSASNLSRVAYAPAHPNPAAVGPAAGDGIADTIWVASEQPGTAEGVLPDGFSAMFDTRLVPGASIGWHEHPDTAEIYYLLEGSLDVHCGASLDSTQTVRLTPGDLHRLLPGHGHWSQAGAQGARIIVVELNA